MIKLRRNIYAELIHNVHHSSNFPIFLITFLSLTLATFLTHHNFHPLRNVISYSNDFDVSSEIKTLFSVAVDKFLYPHSGHVMVVFLMLYDSEHYILTFACVYSVRLSIEDFF